MTKKWYRDKEIAALNSSLVSSSTTDSPSPNALIIDEDRDPENPPELLQDIQPPNPLNNERRILVEPNNFYATNDRRNPPCEFRNSKRSNRNTKGNQQGKENYNRTNGNGHINQENGYYQQRHNNEENGYYHHNKEYHNQAKPPLHPSSYRPTNYFKSKDKGQRNKDTNVSHKPDKYLQTCTPKRDTEINNEVESQVFYNTQTEDASKSYPRYKVSPATFEPIKDITCTPATQPKETSNEPFEVSQLLTVQNSAVDLPYMLKLPAVDQSIKKEYSDERINSIIDEIETEHKNQLHENLIQTVNEIKECHTEASQGRKTGEASGFNDSNYNETSTVDLQEIQMQTNSLVRRKNVRPKNSSKQILEIETAPRFMVNENEHNCQDNGSYHQRQNNQENGHYQQNRDYNNQAKLSLSPCSYRPTKHFKSKEQDHHDKDTKEYLHKPDKHLPAYNPKIETEMKKQVDSQVFYNTQTDGTPKSYSRYNISSAEFEPTKDSTCTPTSQPKEVNNELVYISPILPKQNGPVNLSCMKLPAVDQSIKNKYNEEQVNRLINQIETEHPTQLHENHIPIVNETLQEFAAESSQEITTGEARAIYGSNYSEISTVDVQVTQATTKPTTRRKNARPKNLANQIPEAEIAPRFMQFKVPQYELPIQPPPGFPIPAMHPFNPIFAMNAAMQQNHSYHLPHHMVHPQTYTATRTMSYYNVPNSMHSIYHNGINSPIHYMNNGHPHHHIPGHQQNFYQYPMPHLSMIYPESGFIPQREPMFFRLNNMPEDQYPEQTDSNVPAVPDERVTNFHEP